MKHTNSNCGISVYRELDKKTFGLRYGYVDKILMQFWIG